MDDNYIKNLFLTKSKHLNKNYTQSSWLNKHNDIFNYLLNKYSDSTSIQETLYRIINNVHERPVCNVCGKPVKFKCFSRGFSKHCSRKCVMTDSLIQNKIKDTCLNRYGVTHPMHIENVKNKIKETCLKRYNVTSFTKTEEFKTKLKQTCL
ncbi:hypothetical protein J6O48_03020 [bacterium]|nr:hypothetical protein [bacterium]